MNQAKVLPICLFLGGEKEREGAYNFTWKNPSKNGRVNLNLCSRENSKEMSFLYMTEYRSDIWDEIKYFH